LIREPDGVSTRKWDVLKPLQSFSSHWKILRAFFQALEKSNSQLNTSSAATYYEAGIRSILSTNARDYRLFGCFEVLS